MGLAAPFRALGTRRGRKLLQSLEQAVWPGPRPRLRRRRRLQWARGRELPRLAWGRPAMKWGMSSRRGLRLGRRGAGTVPWRPMGRAASPRVGTASLPGSWTLHPREAPYSRPGPRPQRAVAVLWLLPLVVALAAPLLAGARLGPFLQPYWEAAAPIMDRFRLDGERAAYLVATALPHGSKVGEQESTPALAGGGALLPAAGDRWQDQARAWLASIGRRLPEWLLLNELPALKPAAQPVSAGSGRIGPETDGTGTRPAGGDGGPVIPEAGQGHSSVPALPPVGHLQAEGHRREPLVLIYHSHISEMYHEPGQPLMEPSRYHRFNSTDTGVARAGAALARALEVRGIPVLHDKGIYDYPSHSNAYTASGRAVAAILKRHPSIQVVVDLHRDTPAGMVTTVGGRRVARVTLVVGTTAETGVGHAGWQPNAAFAQELAQALNERAPGVLDRILHVPNRRYNQELHPNAILVEVGSYHNTLAEAEAAAELLAASLAQVLQARMAQGLRVGPIWEVAPPGPDGVKPAGR